MKYTTVGTLGRELQDFDPRWHVYLDGVKLMIGKNHYITLPTKIEREIELRIPPGQ